MATWEDGPEYAPLERPENFTAPAVGPLQLRPVNQSPGSPGVPRAEQLPYGQPAYRALGDERPLRELGEQIPPRRDPLRAFTTASGALTAFEDAAAPRRALSTEIGAAESATPTRPDERLQNQQRPDQQPDQKVFDPYQPMGRYPAHPAATYPQPAGGQQPAGTPQPTGTRQPFGSAQPFGNPEAIPPTSADHSFPAPGTPAWFGPGAAPPPRPSAPPVGAVLTAITPAVVIMLVLAGIVMPLSLPFYIAAMFSSTRICYRRNQVRNVFLGGLGASMVFSLIGLMLSMDSFEQWWGAMSRINMLVSWIVLIILGLLMARALQNGEEPDQVNPRA